MIDIKGLTVRFAGLTAVNDLTMAVPDGTWIGIIGPNGAGKSTVLNAISGTVQASAGSISKDGADIHSLSAYRRSRMGLGRTFQRTSLVPDLTVLENAMLGLYDYRRFGFGRAVLRPRKDRTAEEAVRHRCQMTLELFGMGDKAQRPAGSLGYAEQKMADLARAFVGESDTLLLDEPAAGMSTDERRHLVEQLATVVTERGRSGIIVEHDMEVIRSVASHVVVMATGAKFAEGETAEVLGRADVRRLYLGEQA